MNSRFAWSLAGVLLLCAVPSQAADVPQRSRASDWLGARALDRDGKTLGTVSELVLEPRAGAVHYAVVRSDGWLWLTDPQHLYPITAVTAQAGLVQVQVDREDIGKRTGVDALESDPRPYQPHASAGGQYTPASELIGAELVDAEGYALGTIDDLIFDARNGALRWVVAEGTAFPAKGLEPGDGRFRLVTTKEVRAAAPPQWPGMRATALLEKEVVDRLHRDFGEVRDLRVDLQDGRVEAAVVDRRDDWAAGKALVEVPIEAFSLPRDLPDKVAINYSRERFE